MKIEDLGVARIPQATCKFCGPAVAGMILSKMRVPDGSELPDQPRLHEVIGIEENGLFTTPAGLQRALNQFNPRTDAFFEVRVEDNRLDACRNLVTYILRDKVPAAALIRQCGHWIVVSGLHFEGALDEGRVELDKFIIDDPDDSCLKCKKEEILGVVHGFTIGCEQGRSSDPVLEFATTTEWLEGHWREGCDRVEPGKERFVTIGLAGERVQLELSFRKEPATPLPIGIWEAHGFADRSIKFFQLDQWDRFKPHLDGKWGAVVEVEDVASGNYYLVERRSQRGAVAILRLEKRTGRLLGAQGFSPDKTSDFPVPEGVADALRRARPEVLSSKKVDLSGVFRPDRPLVRKQGHSPYRPMFPIEQEKGRILVGWNGLVTSDK